MEILQKLFWHKISHQDYKHPVQKDALPTGKAGSFTFWERIKLAPQCLTEFNKSSVEFKRV